MTNVSVILKKGIKIHLWILSFLMVIFLFTGQVLAQNVSEVSSKPYTINGKEVKDYLMEKYKLHKGDVRSEIQQTPNGPSGKFHFMRDLGGGIALKNIATINNVQGRENRARAIAQAFLREEATLLGISNIDEIREMKTDTFTSPYTNLTTTNIHYRRYIDGLELKDTYIGITIGHYETIRSVNAELVPTPPDLYEAVKKSTLTEDEAHKIMEEDLLSATNKSDSKEIDISEIKKMAISTNPYVIWTANAGVRGDHGMWKYKLNAFTGEIIKRKYIVIH